MFDTVNGLPVHALVVHALVGLMPLAAIATFAVAVRPSWRRFAAPVVVLDAVVVVLAFVTKESGEALQARLSGLSGTTAAQDHGEQGSLVPVIALVLLAAGVLTWFANRRAALVPVAVVVAGIAGLVALVWIVRTGESGASAVWSDVVSNTQPGGG